MLIDASGVVAQPITTYRVNGNENIAQIIVGAGYDPETVESVRVRRNDQSEGEIIPRSWWGMVKPKQTSEMTIYARPRGDNGSALQSVLTIVLIAGAAAISGGVLGGVLGTAFGAGAFGSSLLSAGVLLAGQVALGALFPSGAEAAQEDLAGGTASAAANLYQKHDYLTRVVGQKKVFPRMISPPLRQSQGVDEIVEVIYGLAGKCVISDLRIDGVPADEVSGLTYQITDWNSYSPTPSLLTQYGTEKPISKKMQWFNFEPNSENDLEVESVIENAIPAWEMVTCSQAYDTVTIRLAWPEGISYSDEKRRVIQFFRLRIRDMNGDTWINLPELVLSNTSIGLVQREIILHFESPPSGLESTAKSTNNNWFHAYSQTAAQGAALLDDGTANDGADFEPAIPKWQSHDSFGSTSSTRHVYEADANVYFADDGVHLYLGHADMPDGPFDLQIKAGAAQFYDEFDFDKYAFIDGADWQIYDNFAYTFNADGNKHESGASNAKYSARPTILSVKAIRRGSPVVGVTKNDAAFISIRGRNTNIQNVSCVATSVVKNPMSGAVVETTNPAILSAALWRGDGMAIGGGSDSIDNSAFQEWADHCTSAGYTAGIECASGVRLDEVQAQLAGSGYSGMAMLSANGGIKPYIEKDRSGEAARFIFTPENSRGWQIDRSWPLHTLDALRVTFVDSENNWERKQILEYAPWANAATAKVVENIEYPAILTEAQARARAAFDLKASRYRSMSFQIETDTIGHSIERGDLVGLVYHVLSDIDQTHGLNESAIGQGGRIVAVNRNGSNQITSIEIDNPVYVEPTEDNLWDVTNMWDVANMWAIGNGYQVGINSTSASNARAAEVAVYSLDISSAGEVSTLTLATPIENDAVAVGQSMTVGRLSRFKRFIVGSIRPNGDNFQLDLVPEAPELWS